MKSLQQHTKHKRVVQQRGSSRHQQRFEGHKRMALKQAACAVLREGESSRRLSHND
jgi:hypothetical protein